MGVAVKEAVVQHLLDDSAHKDDRQLRAIDPRRVQCLDIGDLDAANKFLRHHAACGQVRVDSGHVNLGKYLHVLGQHAAIKCLVAVIDFQQDAVGVLVGNGVNIRVARPSEAPLQVVGQVAHDIEIGAHGDVDIRALHLDNYLLPVAKRGAVHLGGGSGGQRLALKAAVELIHGRAQFARDDLFGDVGGKRCDIALQLRHLFSPVGRQLFGAAGDDLAQLDIGRAKLLQHIAHGFRRRFADQRFLEPINDLLEKAADGAKRRDVKDDVLEIHGDDLKRLGNAQVFGKVVAPTEGKLVERLPVAAPRLRMRLERAVQPCNAFKEDQPKSHRQAAQHAPEDFRGIGANAGAAFADHSDVKEKRVAGDQQQAK